jgi:hypothetical protein
LTGPNQSSTIPSPTRFKRFQHERVVPRNHEIVRGGQLSDDLEGPIHARQIVEGVEGCLSKFR